MNNDELCEEITVGCRLKSNTTGKLATVISCDAHAVALTYDNEMSIWAHPHTYAKDEFSVYHPSTASAPDPSPKTAHFVDVPEGYEPLAAVLEMAFSQCAYGKGKERHANDYVFDEQPISWITQAVGPGFPVGQAIKKSTEALGMIKREKQGSARIEFLGAIIYLAAAYIWSEHNE